MSSYDLTENLTEEKTILRKLNLTLPDGNLLRTRLRDFSLKCSEYSEATIVFLKNAFVLKKKEVFGHFIDKYCTSLKTLQSINILILKLSRLELYTYD